VSEEKFFLFLTMTVLLTTIGIEADFLELKDLDEIEEK